MYSVNSNTPDTFDPDQIESKSGVSRLKFWAQVSTSYIYQLLKNPSTCGPCNHLLPKLNTKGVGHCNEGLLIATGGC